MMSHETNGQKLWERAKNVIPGGNMLFSKRPELFLPGAWPSYFRSAKGCRLIGLDGTEYIDTFLMGVGTNTLGYGHPEVDEAVRDAVTAGNMSSLNCPEEVYLAEKLVELHPWAEMARFARSGGEADAISIRIARAASGKDNVAICGYHGWHDWYLAANLIGEDELSGHLLPGLPSNGVPRALRGTVHAFNYNKIQELEDLIRSSNIGTVVMEVSRNFGPEDGFLEKVRDLTQRNGIVLIFDECTSGFRQSLGGLHKVFGVEPDMAIFGKALGNGYAITAVIGRRSVMEHAQSSFISSTFWTERIGPAAALKTLEVMERTQSWETITETGRTVSRRWLELATAAGIKIQTWGIPALSGFTIMSEKALEYKTFITQEMLKKGYLAGTSIYCSIAHTEEVLQPYFEKMETLFGTIAECENGKDIDSLLDGPVCQSGFKRLN